MPHGGSTPKVTTSLTFSLEKNGMSDVSAAGLDIESNFITVTNITNSVDGTVINLTPLNDILTIS